MQLRSQTRTQVPSNGQPISTPVPSTQRRRPSRRTDTPRPPPTASDVLPLSENGVRHAIRYADMLMETNHTSLHAHFLADGRRLYKRWQECNVATRSGLNSKRIRQNEFEAFVRFILDESGVDITEEVKMI